ncbi:MAG: beta-lactamase family protein, partial [Saprospiraceae bacterium]|nr:beta-lactamase family protein [Saprospiraceae bacterium]
EYSNVGYSLLGIIVEQVSGMNYSAFLQKYIFVPAGMKTAGYDNPAADYNLLTHGYLKDGSDWGTSRDKPWNGKEPHWHLKANGGLLMSAKDMIQWYLALRGNKILKPETLKLQTTPHVSEGEGGSFYGYGYAVLNGGESIEHNGGNGIFRADFRWFPELDLCLVASSNDANVRLFRLNDEVIRILMTGKLPAKSNWQPVAMEHFPANGRQKAAQAMLAVLADFSPEKATDFVKKHYSPGIVERNGQERLIGMLQMLSEDSGRNPVKAIYESEGQIQLALPASNPGATMKIFLTFLGDQVDKLQAEMEGN